MNHEEKSAQKCEQANTQVSQLASTLNPCCIPFQVLPISCHTASVCQQPPALGAVMHHAVVARTNIVHIRDVRENVQN